MIKTRITKMLGIEYPLISGTMMNISTPEFVAAASNAGGLGILASVMYPDPDKLREAIQITKKLTKKPFAVNINLFPMLQPVNNEALVKVMLDEGVPILETSGHKAPKEFIPLFKENGTTWIHKCAGSKYARTAARLGADIIEVVGYENGGATGVLDIGTLVQTPSTVDAVKEWDVPVIAGGGVVDGRSLAAILALGAEGAIMGTRMMATKECPLHQNLKNAFVKAKETDTVLIMRSLNATHRVWHNSAADKILELEKENAEPQEIFSVAAGAKARKMYREGDLDLGVVSCSQGVGLIHDIPTIKELFDRIMKQATEIIKNLNHKIEN